MLSRVTRTSFPRKNKKFDGRRTPSAIPVSFLVSFFFAAKEKSTTICSCYLILYLVLIVLSYNLPFRIFVRKYTVSVRLNNKHPPDTALCGNMGRDSRHKKTPSYWRFHTCRMYFLPLPLSRCRERGIFQFPYLAVGNGRHRPAIRVEHLVAELPQNRITRVGR